MKDMTWEKEIGKKALSIYHKINILLYLLLIDGFIIFLHFWLGGRYELFNIDTESNIPTMYQGFKLLSFGYLFVFKLYIIKDKLKNTVIFWLSSAILFISLGLDEIGQIHENLPNFIAEIFPEIDAKNTNFLQNLNYDGAIWVLYYIPIMILVGVPIFIFQAHYLYKKIGKGAILYILGFILLFSIPVIEIYNSDGLLPLDLYNISIAFEEFFEMAGISLLAFSYLIVFKKENKYTLERSV